MKPNYRVTLQKKTLVEALFRGRIYTEWYVAERKRWWGWKEIGIYPTLEEAEEACELHAGGRLIKGNTMIVSEFHERE